MDFNGTAENNEEKSKALLRQLMNGLGRNENKGLSFTLSNREFIFEGLVIENLDVDVLLRGTLSMEPNDVAIRPVKQQVVLHDGTTYLYRSCSPSEV